MIDLLLVGTSAPDLRGLTQTLGERMDGEVRGLRISAKAVGSGAAASAAATAKRVFLLQPRAVVMIGTCGVYPGLQEYAPLDIVVPNRLEIIDHGADAGLSEFPMAMSTQLPPTPALVAGLAGQRGKVLAVACPSSVTVSDEHAAAVPARHRCQAEHVEAFGVASACSLARIPFGAVLSVTHVVGSHAKPDFTKHHRDATLAAAECFLSWLHGGAAGLPH